MKYYKSIRELDRDLDILKLKTEIEQEKVKLHFGELKQSLSPKTMLSGIVPQVAKGFVLKKVFDKFRRKKKRK